MKKFVGFVAAAVILAGASAAYAESVTYCDSVSFISDTEADQTITLPSFDTQGGALTLTGVTVEVLHSGSADITADNDDPAKSASVKARIIRGALIDGPGVFAQASKTVTSAVVALDPDNGDGAGAFDGTGPDGHFFGTLNYVDEAAFGSPFSPSTALYATAGPGTVDFIVGNAGQQDQLLMVNDLQFEGTPPDQWQLEVVNPTFDIQVCVTYEYVPEPSALSLLGLGGLALLRRR